MLSKVLAQGLSLEVSTRGNLLIYTFNPCNRGEMSPSIQGNQPLDLDVLERHASEIRNLIETSHRNGTGTSATQGLIGKCSRFFEECWPEEIRRALQGSPPCPMKLVVQDSLTGIPWELAHDGTDFLNCRFEVGREVPDWKTEANNPARGQGETVRSILISNPTGDLPESGREGELLSHILSVYDRGEVDLINGRVTQQIFLEALGSYDLFHFSGHVACDNEDCGWRLWDGVLSPHEAAAALPHGRGFPLLFFDNACNSEAPSMDPSKRGRHTAQVSIAKGCLHYLGVIADLLDDSAKKFARIFYQHLLLGESVGRSLREARLEVRSDASETDLTWAQYVLYGNPETGIFGETLTGSELVTLLFGRDGPDPGPRSWIEEATTKDLLQLFPHAESLSVEERGGFIRFDRPSEAVRFAILRNHPDREGPLEKRKKFGIHMGEVFLDRAEDRSRLLAVRGVPVEEIKEMVRAASPGQILLSKPVFDSARAVLSGNEIGEIDAIEWLDHGNYFFKKLHGSINLCEVGETGLAPFSPPLDRPEVYRNLSPDQEPVLGWRPALDQTVPTSPNWKLIEKLGEGGFGEVWRARSSAGIDRIFKFCFRADRVRALKREVTLFKLLRENVGDHPNIVKIHDVYFETPPFYIEMEDVKGVDLVKWCEDQGGLASIGDNAIFTIVRGVASALQAAHDSGIIHRDVKPSNILIRGSATRPESIEVKLTDFGIGLVVSTSITPLVTLTGFTETYGRTEMSSGTGSRLYLPPEILVGERASTRSDIYSLGVVLYQLVVRDFKKPLTPDWRGEIEDEVLRSDIEGCVAGDPKSRFSSATLLSERLGSIESRREMERRKSADLERARRRQRLSFIGGSITAILLAISIALGVGFYQAMKSREEAETARGEAELALADAEAARQLAESQTKVAERDSHFASIQLARQLIDQNRFLDAKRYLYSCPPNQRHWEWGYLLAQCNQDIMTLTGHQGEVGAVDYSPDGKSVASADAQGNVIVWDLASAKERFRCRGHTRGVWCLDFSESGKWIVTGSEDNTARVWSATDGTQIAVLPSDDASEITAVEFRKDSSWVLTGSTTGRVLMWKGLTGELTADFSVGPSRVASLSFHPDGYRLVIGSQTELKSEVRRDAVDIIELDTGNRTTLFEDQGRVRWLKVAPDGKSLGVSWVNRKWDWFEFPHPEKPVLSFVDDHKEDIWSFDFSPNGKRIVTAAMDGVALVYSLQSGKILHRLIGHEQGIYSAAFSPDGDFVATAGADGTVKIWYVGGESSFRRTAPAPFDIRTSLFTPDGKRLVMNGSGGFQSSTWTVPIFDLQEGRQTQILAGHPSEIKGIDVFPNKMRLLSTGHHRPEARIWNLESGEEIASFFIKGYTGHNLFATDCDVSPGGDRAAICFDRGRVGLYQLASEAEIACAHSGGNADGDFVGSWSQDGSLYCTGNSDGQIEFWSGKDLSLIKRVNAHTMTVTDIAFDPLGRWVATSSRDRKVNLWSLRDFSPHISLSSHQEFVNRVRFSKDGGRLFSVDRGGSLNIWRTTEGEIIALLSLTTPGNLPINSLCQDPENERIVLGLGDRTHLILDAFDPNQLETIGMGKEEDLEDYKREYWGKRLPHMPGGEPRELQERLPHLEGSEIGNPFLLQAIQTEVDRQPKEFGPADLNGIAEIDLNGKGVTDLRDIEKLRGLVSLKIDDNPITDLSPLKDVPNLIALSARNVPLKDLEVLRDIKKLRSLIFSSPHPVDLTPIGDLTHLEVLDVEHQNLGNLDFLAKCRNLRSIHASNCELQNVDMLGSLQKLEEVYIPWNPVATLSGVWTHPRLWRLILHHTKISNLDFVSGLSALTDFDIGSLPVESLKPLANCRMLEKIEASYTAPHTAEGLEGLPHLQYINFQGSQLRSGGGLKNLPRLSRAHLQETLIDSISDFEKLEGLHILDLSNTQLKDLRGIESCPNLNHLMLTNIPAKDLSSLASLGQLDRLDLRAPEAHSLAPLQSLMNLTQLRIYDTPGDGDWSFLGSLTKLDHCTMHRCKLSDLRGFHKHPLLRHLDVSDNEIVDLTPLAELPNLKLLAVSQNPIRNIAPVASIQSLHVLNAAYIPVEDFSPVGGLGNLKELTLSYTPLQDGTFLQNLQHLEALYLETTKVRKLPNLKGCSNLTQIYMAGNFIEDSTPFAEMQSLNYLDLSYSPLKEITSLKSCPNLQHVLVRQTQIRSSTSYAELPNLNSVNHMLCELEDVEGFRHHKHLKELLLHGNSIEDVTPLLENPHIGPGFKLDLSANPLSDWSREFQIPKLMERGVEVNLDRKSAEP